MLNEYKYFLLHIKDNIVSPIAYKNSFISFFKQTNLKKENCFFFLARKSLLEGSSVYSICSKEIKIPLLKLRHQIMTKYSNELINSDLNNLIPLSIHQDYQIQLYRERTVFDYFLLFNVNGIVFNFKSVIIT